MVPIVHSLHISRIVDIFRDKVYFGTSSFSPTASSNEGAQGEGPSIDREEREKGRRRPKRGRVRKSPIRRM